MGRDRVYNAGHNSRKYDVTVKLTSFGNRARNDCGTRSRKSTLKKTIYKQCYQLFYLFSYLKLAKLAYLEKEEW